METEAVFYFSPSRKDSIDICYLPPNMRLKKPGFWAAMKRMGFSSPRKRSITS